PHASSLACCVASFHPTPTMHIYTLSLHDALPIYSGSPPKAYLMTEPNVAKAIPAPRIPVHRVLPRLIHDPLAALVHFGEQANGKDRKSTRLNSSHVKISYAGFCLKKKSWPEPHR